MKFTLNHAWLLALSALLLGCNGGEEGSVNEDTNQNNVLPTLFTSTSVNSVFLGSDYESTVDLSSDVGSSDGVTPEVVDVKSISETSTCHLVGFDTKEVTVSSTETTWCAFEYTVEHPNTRQRMKGTKYIRAYSDVTSLTTGDLTTINKSTNLGVTLTINLEDQTDFPTGGALSNIEVFGGGAASTNGNVITFSNDAIGHSYILYQVHDASSNVHLGRIEIATGTGMSAPNARTTLVLKYDNKPIRVGQKIEIEVDADDPDGDTVQLIVAIPNTGKVSFPNDPNFDNKKFFYTPLQAGENLITYVVSDKKGGFSSAKVVVTVESPFDTFTVGSLTYLPPMDYVSAKSLGIPIYDAGVGNGTTAPTDVNLYTVDFDIASALCSAKGGRLPTSTELVAAHTEKGNLFNASNWPVSNPYFTSSFSSDNKVVNLGSGASSTGSLTRYFYACVK
ncbi:Ig-like domain-containing protein [Vibrio sp. NTOU-M3]|uniref:Ig-like domain-containing protein n=1 Tax=Vibrio sp. NTOU-M3 TaxID=3234954 RepID=UPI00349F3872